MSDLPGGPARVSFPKSKAVIARTGWKNWGIITALALAVFLLAKIVVFGAGLDFSPIVTTPIQYSGDALFFAHMASLLQDGWINVSLRDGYPFGSELYDFPTSDSGNFFIIKLLMQVVKSPFTANNLFYLLSYPFIFVVSALVFRGIGLRSYWSYAAAALFTFLPFHQMRFGHLLYTMYFTIPLLFYVGYKAASGETFLPYRSGKHTRLFVECVILAALASFGVYNAAFAVILVAFGGVFHAVSQRRYQTLLHVIPWILAIVAGVLINLLPNILHWSFYGKSPEVAHRDPGASEIYGLKFIQLLTPIPNHFLNSLAVMGKTYNATAPLVNENITAALGLAGSVGLFIAGVVLLQSFVTINADRRQNIITFLLIVLLFFGTIGGGGAIFAYTVSPLIRGWNRISPFIGFAAIALLFLQIQSYEAKWSFARHIGWAAPVVAVILVLIGIADQTGWRCDKCLEDNRVALARDRDFIERIESIVPPDSAIYQLPYQAFPESGGPNSLVAYDHFVLTANSAALKSSYGVMHSYPGDKFYRELGKRPLREQVEVLRRLGFRGLWINGRGYADGGIKIIDEASTLFGHGPDAKHGNNEVVFFRIPNPVAVELSNLNSKQIIIAAGLSELGGAEHVSMGPGSRMVFSTPNLPSFVASLTGLSGPESWGRWTDASLGPSAIVKFKEPLPPKIKLRVELIPFGPNTDKPITIRVGDHIQKINLISGYNMIVLDPGQSKSPVTEIEFTPFAPTSPASTGISSDRRVIGVGLRKIEAFE